jgi:hypothetical protein
VSTSRSIHAVPSITPSPREGIEDGPRLRVRTRGEGKLTSFPARPCVGVGEGGGRESRLTAKTVQMNYFWLTAFCASNHRTKAPPAASGPRWEPHKRPRIPVGRSARWGGPPKGLKAVLEALTRSLRRGSWTATHERGSGRPRKPVGAVGGLVDARRRGPMRSTRQRQPGGTFWKIGSVAVMDRNSFATPVRVNC